MSFALLALATPIFGLSLRFDADLALRAQVLAQIEAPLEAIPAGSAPDASTNDASPPDAQTPEVEPAPSAPETPASIAPEAVASAAVEPVEPPSAEDDRIASALARRARMARIHRALGLATWASMTLTTILGTIQYYNLYGFFSSQANTPCVRGTEVGGLHSCLGAPVLHGTSAAMTSALYFTTFGLSFAMPDPIGLDRGDSASARRLRRHKRLRWAHLSGMVAQMLLGIVIANDRAFGIDRANHYDTLQRLATVHMLTGYATYGTLTWAGATMLGH